MDFRILDKNFRDQMVLSQYESLLWVDRYNECGDFEIYTPPTEQLLEIAVVDSYLYNKQSEHMMIIEHVELQTSYDEGDRLIIKGRSLECILARRILWYKTQFRSNLEDAIRQILDYSMINPPDPDRKINNFIFEYSNDTEIRKYFVNAEYEIGTDLLTVVQELCKSVNVGFKITLNSSNQFVFKLYRGANRSYNQDSNAWIVFSNRYHNLKTTQFSNDITEYKNAVRTLGKEIDGEAPLNFMTYGGQKSNVLDLTAAGGDEEPTIQIEDGDYPFEFTIGKLKPNEKYTFTSKIQFEVGEPTNIYMELVGEYPHTRVYATANPTIQNGRITATFTVIQPDARYDDCRYLVVYSGSGITLALVNPILSQGEPLTKITGLERREVFNDAANVEYTDEITDAEYKLQLLESAYKMLEDNIVKSTINGEVEANATFQYGRDYNIGDIVQVENEFGVLGTMRVTEFITSHSTSGLEMYPTFKSTGGTE